LEDVARFDFDFRCADSDLDLEDVSKHFRAEGDNAGYPLRVEQAKARSKWTPMNTDAPASGGEAILMPGRSDAFGTEVKRAWGNGNFGDFTCGRDGGEGLACFCRGMWHPEGHSSMNAPTFFPKPFDSIGRRVSKQVWTRTGGSWVEENKTAFVYDGWNLISEISNLPSQIQSSKHYAWGLDLSLSIQGAGGIHGLLAQMHSDSSGSSQVIHYTYDLNGNISEVLDGSGTIAAHYEYGPFGEMLREAYPSLEVRRSLGEGGFRVSTKYRDAETGLLYYGYRYYDPTAGRWLNRDPIEEAGGCRATECPDCQ
jgi:RHS repeat-associated protein